MKYKKCTEELKEDKKLKMKTSFEKGCIYHSKEEEPDPI